MFVKPVVVAHSTWEAEAVQHRETSFQKPQEKKNMFE